MVTQDKDYFTLGLAHVNESFLTPNSKCNIANDY